MLTDEQVNTLADQAEAGFDIGPDGPVTPDDCTLIIGPTENGRLLEVMVVELAGGDRLVVHAMEMREQYRALLP